MDAIKMLLAGQTASNNALLGAVKSGFMKREKADVEPTFNWMGTHTGNDVAKFMREVLVVHTSVVRAHPCPPQQQPPGGGQTKSKSKGKNNGSPNSMTGSTQ